MTYQIKTPIFEGPISLLLDLIERRKLEINQISLAAVTDDFLNYVKTLTEFKLGDVSQFILVAATLILIKSKSLLPAMELTAEEESSIGDLEERLRRYQIIKSVLPVLKKQFGKNIIFYRQNVPFSPVFAPGKLINLKNLAEAVRQVIEEMPKKEFLTEVAVGKVISLQEMMHQLIDRIERSLQLTFKEISNGDFKNEREKKFHIIVSFLALLELIHQGLVVANQDRQFEDITLIKI